jgi:hypothetical protein
MVALSELNKISIAIVVFYAPALLVAIWLSVKHGFGRSAGWLYLILLSLIRLIGAALQLATINDPTNIGLYVGAATLQSVALSPLILCGLGLISRVVESIRHHVNALVTPRNIKMVQLLVGVGLILMIVGGAQLANTIGHLQGSSSSQPSAGTSYTLPTLSLVGLGLTIGGFALLVLVTVATGFQIRNADHGEKRLALAVALSIPFITVRIIYAGLGIYGSNPDFKTFGGSPHYADYFLGMAVVMEMAVVIIFAAVGVTLHKLPKEHKGQNNQMVPVGYRADGRVEEGRQYGY